jgi:hypothetical protein
VGGPAGPEPADADPRHLQGSEPRLHGRRPWSAHRRLRAAGQGNSSRACRRRAEMLMSWPGVGSSSRAPNAGAVSAGTVARREHSTCTKWWRPGGEAWRLGAWSTARRDRIGQGRGAGGESVPEGTAVYTHVVLVAFV